MSTEIAVLQAEADALHGTIISAVRALIERHPDLCIRIDGSFHRDPCDSLTGAWHEIESAAGSIAVKLSVDVGVTGR